MKKAIQFWYLLLHHRSFDVPIVSRMHSNRKPIGDSRDLWLIPKMLVILSSHLGSNPQIRHQVLQNYSVHKKEHVIKYTPIDDFHNVRKKICIEIGSYINKFSNIFFCRLFIMFRHELTEHFQCLLWWLFHFHVHKCFGIIVQFRHLDSMQKITSTVNLTKKMTAKLIRVKISRKNSKNSAAL